MASLRQQSIGCIGLLFVALPTLAQIPMPVGRRFQQEVVSRQTHLLEDPSGRLTITDILQKSHSFKRYDGPTINPGFTNSFFWVRFRVYNPDSLSKELFLEVENPHLNKLQLFTQTAQEPVRGSLLTGDHFPFQQRAVRHPHFLFPITIASHQTMTCYLWVDKHGEQVQIPLRLWDKEYFTANAYKLYLFVGFMLGIGGLYCILSLFSFLFFRTQLTLYYFFYTVSVWLFLAAHTGLGFMLLWPYETWWTSAARPTTAMLIYAFSLLFAQVFFQLWKTNRWLYRYTQLLLGLIGVLLLTLYLQNPVLGLFKEYWYNPIWYRGEGLLRYMILAHLVATLSLISVMSIGIIRYVQNRRAESVWFSAGYIMLLFSGLVLIAIHAGYMPDNYITQNFPLLATAFETVILSFLLANRFKTIHQDNARISAELADQRHRNAIQLLEGQRIERKRLSQELHDGISLSIANIRLKLSLLAENLNGQRTEAQQLVEALSEVGQDVRQFSHALSPVMLERYGLADALDELAQTVTDSHPGLSVSIQHSGVNNESIQLLVAQTMYHISLELLNNITKHAQARQATLQLTQTTDRLILTVSDNGIGYDVGDKAFGIGLQNIQARVALLNGQFTITRLPAGMQHRIDLPIQTRLFS